MTELLKSGTRVRIEGSGVVGTVVKYSITQAAYFVDMPGFGKTWYAASRVGKAGGTEAPRIRKSVGKVNT